MAKKQKPDGFRVGKKINIEYKGEVLRTGKITSISRGEISVDVTSMKFRLSDGRYPGLNKDEPQLVLL